MRYIQRDTNGEIVGHFANPQSYATENLDDDHPDLVAFDKKRKAATLADYSSTSNPPSRAHAQRITALESRCAVLENQVEILRQRLLDEVELKRRIETLEKAIGVSL